VRSSLRTELGRELLARVELRLPESINFRVERDLVLVYVGAYALQGVDFAGVAIGQFDAKAIAETAASQRRDNPAAALVVASQYAGRTLYTIGNIGCSLLTDKTLLFGNEIGMRRALDRIESGRIGDDIEPWLRELFRIEAASLALGVDFTLARPPETLEARAPLLVGLDRARVLGNFAPPGINLAGTLSYADVAAAEHGASAIDAFRSQLRGVGLVASLLGAAQPITKLEARVVQQDAQFVLEVDGRLLLALLERFLPRSGAQ
jgi:hypothetical protein